MLSIRTFIFGIITVCFSINLYSQNTFREKDYVVNYHDKNIELVFDVPVFIKAYDVNSKAELTVIVEESKENSFVITYVLPAQIIKVEYSYLYGNQTTYIANQSLSTGTIDVYFNHPVDTSVSQTQNTVNLGSALDDKLINYINACVGTLDIAIYNSYSASGTVGIAGAINAAYNRGVQVRVIYDGSTSSVMIPLLNAGIPTLASPTSSSYGIMHNKFVVFDAMSDNPFLPLVWTGSTNWTVAQIDGPDKNSAIVIQDQAMAMGYKMEFEEMWGSSGMVPNLTLSKFGQYKTDNTPHSYLIGGKVVNSYFSPSDGVNAKIISAINTANSDLDIATMLITKSDISTAILDKYNSGMNSVNVVVDSQNLVGSQLSVLQAGLPLNHAVVYTGSGIMHHKFMCIDNFNSGSDPQVLVGLHNWSNAAETKNDENTLIVHDANITNQYYQAFVYLYGAAGGVLGTEENVFENDGIVLYPNPTNGVLNISTKNGLNDVEVVVYDAYGKRVYSGSANGGVDLSGVERGLYFVEVGVGGVVERLKVVRE